MEPKPAERLEVDGVVLRPPAEADRAQYLEILNRSDEVARWTNIPFPYSSSDFDSFLNNPGGEHRFAIERAGAVVGGIGARIDTEAQTALVGYWLAPEARGSGIITRAGRALCQELFACGIQRIVAEVVVGNLASGAVLDRLGFTLEGIARSVHAPRCGLDDQRVDEQIWSLLPGELTAS